MNMTLTLNLRWAIVKNYGQCDSYLCSLTPQVTSTLYNPVSLRGRHSHLLLFIDYDYINGITYDVRRHLHTIYIYFQLVCFTSNIMHRSVYVIFVNVEHINELLEYFTGRNQQLVWKSRHLNQQLVQKSRYLNQ